MDGSTAARSSAPASPPVPDDAGGPKRRFAQREALTIRTSALRTFRDADRGPRRFDGHLARRARDVPRAHVAFKGRAALRGPPHRRVDDGRLSVVVNRAAARARTACAPAPS